jgi:hypothetical protein
VVISGSEVNASLQVLWQILDVLLETGGVDTTVLIEGLESVGIPDVQKSLNDLAVRCGIGDCFLNDPYFVGVCLVKDDGNGLKIHSRRRCFNNS